MANSQAFNPTQAATVNIDVSASSQSVALGPPATGGYRQIRIVNDGSATVWVTFGGSTITAALASGIPVRQTTGRPEVITVPSGVTHVAAIAAAATGKIYFTPGSGL
jgi:hypothetical protein